MNTRAQLRRGLTEVKAAGRWIPECVASIVAATEESMRALDIIPRICSKLTGSLRRRPEFRCGQCERWQQCGLPPSNDCIFRAIQIARDAGSSIPRVKPPHWWGILGA
jgi:hypothetical protein